MIPETTMMRGCGEAGLRVSPSLQHFNGALDWNDRTGERVSPLTPCHAIARSMAAGQIQELNEAPNEHKWHSPKKYEEVRQPRLAADRSTYISLLFLCIRSSADDRPP
jgi:hypothetical protein